MTYDTAGVLAAQFKRNKEKSREHKEYRQVLESIKSLVDRAGTLDAETLALVKKELRILQTVDARRAKDAA